MPKSTVPVRQANACSLSTTWEWRKVMLRASSPPPGDLRAAGAPSRFSPSRSRFNRATFQIQFRGGPEGSFVVWSGDRAWRFPGHRALIDVMMQMADL